MEYPAAAGRYAERLRTLAGEVRQLMREPTRADMLERIAADVERTVREDDDLLLSEAQALAYTRGYSADHLARICRNHGTPTERMYRKGDLPRKPATAPNGALVTQDSRGRTKRVEEV